MSCGSPANDSAAALRRGEEGGIRGTNAAALGDKRHKSCTEEYVDHLRGIGTSSIARELTFLLKLSARCGLHEPCCPASIGHAVLLPQSVRRLMRKGKAQLARLLKEFFLE